MEPAYKLSRRKFLQAALVAAAATGSGVACSGSGSPWRFLTVDEAPAAYEKFDSRTDGYTKVVLKPAGGMATASAGT